MAITKETLRSSIYNTIYTHINTNVVDPMNRQRQWIFSSYPEHTATNFVGYPIIVINKVELDKSFEIFDNNYSEKKIPIVITVFSTKASVVDTLSDALDEAMRLPIDKSLTNNDYSEQEGQLIVGNKPVHYRIHNYIMDVNL